MEKKTGDWSAYVALFAEALRNPKEIRAIFLPHIGKTFERPDKKMRDKIVAVEYDGKVYIDRFVVLEKPADFIQFRYEAKQMKGEI